MAFAIASGVTPEAGIFTAIVAGLAVSLFGGSRFQIAGPTGAFVPLLLSIYNQHGFGGLQLATLLAGIFLIAMGMANFGSLLKYMPTQVVVGFTAGIGILLFWGQIGHFFGNRGGGAPDMATVSMGIGCLALLLCTRHIPLIRRIPAPLLVLILSSAARRFLPIPSVATVGNTFGQISSALPRLSLPSTASWACSINLLGPAFAIAVLCAIESLLSAVVADGMTADRHNSNQELIGQGVANLLSPLFGGIAATGAIARTAANVRAGATSPISGVACAIFLLLTLTFCAPLAQHIPLVALSAILFTVAYRMVDFSYFGHLLRHAPMSDVVILLITFCLTVFCGLVIAVNAGVVLSALLLMRRLAAASHIDCNRSLESGEDVELLTHPPSDIAIYTVNGPLFFAMVERLEMAISQVRDDVRGVILRLAAVPFVDATALANLRRAIEKLESSGKKFALCEASGRVVQWLKRAKIRDSVDDKAPQKTLHEAIDAIHRLLPTDSKLADL